MFKNHYLKSKFVFKSIEHIRIAVLAAKMVLILFLCTLIFYINMYFNAAVFEQTLLNVYTFVYRKVPAL